MAEFDPWYHPTGTATAPPAPTGPPAAPPGTVTYDPGYTPDYGNIIKHDPGYLTALNAAEFAKNNASAFRRQTLRDALIRYGGLPTGFKDQYGDFDAATLELAKGNQNSVLSQLKNNMDQSGHQMRGQLAARGMLQSGELNYGSDQLNRSYAQQQYDASNVFGQTAQGAIGQYTGVLSQNAQNMAQAIAQAESNSYGNPAYQPRSPKTANYNAGLSSQWGEPVYTDDNGNTYDANGQARTYGGNWWA